MKNNLLIVLCAIALFFIVPCICIVFLICFVPYMCFSPFFEDETVTENSSTEIDFSKIFDFLNGAVNGFQSKAAPTEDVDFTVMEADEQNDTNYKPIL